jgi:hypothetical protein
MPTALERTGFGVPLRQDWDRGFIAFRLARRNKYRLARRTSTGRDRYCATVRRAKMSDPRTIFEQTSKTTRHPNEFRFE